MRRWRAGAPEGAAFLCNSAYFAESDRRFRSQDIGVSHCASCSSALSRFPIARQSRRYRDTSAATTLLAPRCIRGSTTLCRQRRRTRRRYQRERDHERGGPGSIRAPVSMSPARHWAGTACTADRSSSSVFDILPLALAWRGPGRRPQHEAARRVNFVRSAPPVPPDLSESGRRRGRRPAREFQPPSAAWASTRRWCTGGARLHAQRIHSYRPRRRRHADHA